MMKCNQPQRQVIAHAIKLLLIYLGRRYRMKYENIKKWEKEECYFGDDMSDYYCIYSYAFNIGSILEEANFKALSNIVLDTDIYRFQHWVSPFDSILIHESRAELLKELDEIMGEYNRYPVIDEQLYSDMQFERCQVLADEIQTDFESNPGNNYWDESLTKNSTREEIEDYIYNSDMVN